MNSRRGNSWQTEEKENQKNKLKNYVYIHSNIKLIKGVVFFERGAWFNGESVVMDTLGQFKDPQIILKDIKVKAEPYVSTDDARVSNYVIYLPICTYTVNSCNSRDRVISTAEGTDRTTGIV